MSLPLVSFKRQEQPDRLTVEQQGSASVPVNLCEKFSLCSALLAYSYGRPPVHSFVSVSSDRKQQKQSRKLLFGSKVVVAVSSDGGKV